MTVTIIILIVLVLLSGLYMAWNIGANDVANALGTSVGSGALSLRGALLIAAVLEFSGALFFGSHVSKTMEQGIINADFFQDPMILAFGFLASLIGAGLWLQIASYCGWPVSTTHSICGALVGFGLIQGGIDAVYWENIFQIASAWVVSPIIGGVIAYLGFHFILRKILFVNHPLKAAKKIVPYLVGSLGIIFALVFSFDWLQHQGLDFFSSLLVCLFLGPIMGLMASFLLRRMGDSLVLEERQIDPQMLFDLKKAHEHLENAQQIAQGELEYNIARLREEIESLSYAAQQVQSSHRQESESKAVERIFGKVQWISACLMAFSHGANDVANAIGPLVGAIGLLTTGALSTQYDIPYWALILGGSGIVLGLATWGWRVIETIGKKLTELTPTRGFAAEFAAASTILIASRFGFPVSATHTLVGAVLGVGMARGLESINLNMISSIVVSWIITIPAGALFAILSYHVIFLFFG